MLWLVVAGSVVATILTILSADTASFAAPPGLPFSGKRLFEAFSKKPTPPQAFIPAPTPPPAPAVAKPEDSPSAAADSPRPPRIGTLPPQANPAPARAPTWDETISFAKSLKSSAGRVAAAAVDPAYKPEPKPQRAPITTAGRAPPKAAPSTAAPKMTAAMMRQQAAV